MEELRPRVRVNRPGTIEARNEREKQEQSMSAAKESRDSRGKALDLHETTNENE